MPPTEPAAAVATPAAQPTAAPEARLGKLAFVRGGDLWLKELPNGEERQLTSDGRNREPRWSPSGEWVAFVKRAETGELQLWMMHGSGGEPRLVDSPVTGHAFWSPAADRLAYVTDGSMVTEDADGSNLRETFARVDGDPAWSPDGKWLAFGRIDEVAPAVEPKGPPLRASIWLVRADGSDPKEIANGGSPSPGGFLVAGWSPDGSSVLYWTNPYFSGSFAADGGALMSIPVGGGQPREIAKGMLLHRDFLSWSPSGQELALVDGSYRSTWYRKQIAVSRLLGPVQSHSEVGRADLYPAWSPDGRLIAFTSAGVVETDGGNEAKQASWDRRIWVMAQDGSGKRQLTSDPAYRDEQPVWSRDGSSILFGRMIGDTMQLWLMRADGSGQRQVVDELSPLPDPVAGWFGYYGYLDWDRTYDWWQDKRTVSSDAPAPAPTPTPALTAETDEERVEIARRLFGEYLEGFKSTTDLKKRLLDYRIDEVRLLSMPPEPRPRLVALYSVLPLIPHSDEWVAGNGTVDTFWITSKQLYVEVVRDGDGYRLQLMGTGG